MKSIGDASNILYNTAYAQPSATFTLTPQVFVNGTVVASTSFRVVSIVPTAKQQTFVKGVKQQLTGLLMNVPGLQPPFDLITALLAWNIYLNGCNIAFGSQVT